MCGLTGISIGKRFNKGELSTVKQLFTRTLLAHEERGKEATGAIIIWPDGTYKILKISIQATEFIKTEEYNIFLKEWDNKVCTVLGHTRRPTKGSIWNEDNNHPVIVGDMVGIHNGTINNDDILFEKEKLTRKAEVDSEIIFSMLNNMNSSHNYNELVSEIQNCTKKISGSFTTISTSLKSPRELLLLKYNQPLSFHYSKTLSTFFFTSRYLFLRKAFGRAVITEALPSKMAYVFNFSGNTTNRGRPAIQFPISSYDDEIDNLQQ